MASLSARGKTVYSPPYSRTGTCGLFSRKSARERRPVMVWVRAIRSPGMVGCSVISVSPSGGADLVEQVRGELVGQSEASAQGVAGDRASVAVLVFVGHAA